MQNTKSRNSSQDGHRPYVVRDTMCGPVTFLRAQRGVRAHALLDLENLLHDARKGTRSDLESAFRRLIEVIKGCAGHVTAEGCGDYWLVRRLVPAAHEVGARLFPGPLGKDRADSELISRAKNDVPSSCDVLVIGSGDHGFSNVAARHRDAGRYVIAVARTGSLATRLRESVDEWVWFDNGLGDLDVA